MSERQTAEWCLSLCVGGRAQEGKLEAQEETQGHSTEVCSRCVWKWADDDLERGWAGVMEEQCLIFHAHRVAPLLQGFKNRPQQTCGLWSSAKKSGAVAYDEGGGGRTGLNNVMRRKMDGFDLSHDNYWLVPTG